jgi:hypothetical protein
MLKDLKRFSAGPKGVEFEMSMEHRQVSAGSQISEAVLKIER